MTARFQGLQTALAAAPIVANQIYYLLLGRQVERELAPPAIGSGLGLVVYSLLAGGFLSGKYQRDAAAPEGTRRATFQCHPFRPPHGQDVVDVLQRLGDGYGVPPAHVALAWTMQRPAVSSVLFGISRPSQLEENLGATDLVLDDSHIAELNALTALDD